MKSFLGKIFFKCFNYYNYVSKLIFSLCFYPYYYRISKYGKIIKYKYISRLYTDTLTTDDFFITYECDKNLKLFNRIIFSDIVKITQNSLLNISTTPYKSLNYISFADILRITSDSPTSHNHRDGVAVNYTKYIFTNIILNIFNKEHTIYLRTDNYNFYFVGNIINYSFIQYYILNILQSNIFSIFNKEMYDIMYIKGLVKNYANKGMKVPYSLTIIDHKFNMITLNQDDSIVLNQSDYDLST